MRTETTSQSTVVFGDIHGSTYWKKVVDENPGCRYIFLGDYLDPYEDIAPEKLIENLKEIMQLKNDRHERSFFCWATTICIIFVRIWSQAAVSTS